MKIYRVEQPDGNFVETVVPVAASFKSARLRRSASASSSVYANRLSHSASTEQITWRHSGRVVAYPDITPVGVTSGWAVMRHEPQQHPALKRRWKPPTQYWRRDSGV
jgi:hypothetical protein